MESIPFNKPCVLGSEVQELKSIFEKGLQFAGTGSYGKKSEEQLKQITGSPALLTSSASHALEMMALLLNIQSGDEVILPSFTFVSTANAFLLRGAKLRFVDNDEFGNIDPRACEKVLSARTKAIVAMHYGGNASQLPSLVALARKSGVALVEDAAQSIGVRFQGKHLGTFGALGCLSFHDTKNVTSGEGGALLINDVSLLERGEILREKGTNRSRFLRGFVDKYTWVDCGSSYLMSEFNAAVLSVQLGALAEINRRRKQIWDAYSEALSDLARQGSIEVLKIAPDNEPNYHLFGLFFEKPAQRNAFIEGMKSRGVATPFHYVALHMSEMGTRLGYKADYKDFPNCERFSERMVRLPIYYNMSDSEIAKVCDAARACLK